MAAKSTDREVASAKGDVAEKIAEEQEQGFRGTKVDPVPDSEYSLESGPDSPSAVPDDVSRVGQHAPQKEG